MRYIKIPDDYKVVSLDDESFIATLSFSDFVKSRTADASFGTDIDGVESALDIRRSLKDKSPGEVWQIEESDWKRLCKATTNPQAPYNPGAVAEAIVVFKNIICNATVDRPVHLKAVDE